MHGLVHISISKSLWKVIFWTTISVAALIALSAHFSVTVLKYYDYGYTETTSLRNEIIKFPDVTVCSYSAFDPLKLKFSGFLDVPAFFEKNVFDKYKNQYGPNSEITQEDFVTRRSIYANTDPQMRNWLGYDWQDIVLYCKFAGTACKKEHFEKKQQTDFFNCYTLEAKDVKTKINRTTHPHIGPQDGLSMILFTNNHEIERPYSFSNTYDGVEGMRIQVHQPDSLSTPLQLGFDVPPGMSTSVALSTGLRQRLPTSYTRCHQANDKDYSITGCRNACLQTHVLRTYGCLTLDVPVHDFFKNGIYDYCLKWNSTNPNETFTRITCEQTQIKNFSRHDLCNNCTLPCNEEIYSMTTSQSRWPSKYEFRNLLSQLLTGNRDSLFLRQLHCKRLCDKIGEDRDAFCGNELCFHNDTGFNNNTHEPNFQNQDTTFDDINITELIDSFPRHHLYEWVTNNLLRVNIYFGDDTNTYQVSSLKRALHLFLFPFKLHF